MYAGIVIDTKNFTNQAGVRTFEAAAFLRTKRSGCHPSEKAVPGQIWRIIRQRPRLCGQAEVYMDAFAISVCPVGGTGKPDGCGGPGGQ